MSSQRLSRQTTTRREFFRAVGSAAAIGLAAPSASRLRVFSGTIPETTTTSKKPLVIDTHMHVWSHDAARFPLAAGIQARGSAGTVEVLAEEMDEAGVDHCVLVQSIHHQWDNRYVAHCLRQHPQRFRVQGLVDPTKQDAAERLEYWMREHGFSGIRLRPIYHRGNDGWLHDKSSYPLWRTAEKLNAIFNFYIGTEQLPKLELMLRRFPRVKVVIDHLSQIDLKTADPLPEMKRLLALARYPQVFVKVSELASVSSSGIYPYSDSYPWIKLVYDAFSPDRLLWGTGYPGSKARATARRPSVDLELALIREKIPFLTPTDQKKILGLNAQKLWNFGERV